jgi:hypothetical protein
MAKCACGPRSFDDVHRLRKYAKDAGVCPLPFHCTRHTFITWALESETPVKRVSEWVGASVSVIERTYAHVMPQIAPDLSFADMGRKWGETGMTTPFSDIEKGSEVSDGGRELNGDPGAIRWAASLPCACEAPLRRERASGRIERLSPLNAPLAAA